MCRPVSSTTVMEVLLAGCTTVVLSGRYDSATLGTVMRRRTNAHWLRTRNVGQERATWDQGWSMCATQ